MSNTKVTDTGLGSNCSFCHSKKLYEIIDFGNVALAGGFLKTKDAKEKKYPLKLVFCETCYAVQVNDHIDPEVLFSTDYYFSSTIKTLKDHFSKYAGDVVTRFIKDPNDASVLEFGSNDGVLLRPLADSGIKTVIGVDPAKNIVKTIEDNRLTLVNDFFSTKTASNIVEKYGKMDLIMANNVFAHISDINNVTEAVRNSLKDDGVFVFEVHYLGKIIEELQYDFIYHEHIYYHSLLSLKNHMKRHGMTIFDLKQIPIHGGSIRFYAAKNTSGHSRSVSQRVIDLEKEERKLRYDKHETYKNFRNSVESKKAKLMETLNTLRKEGCKIVGYGASGRANTIIQYCRINHSHLDYIIDDSPAKHGLYTPGSHLEIKSNQALKKDQPDYVLLFAWSFFKEIIKKNRQYTESGGRVIIPLPEVKIVS